MRLTSAQLEELDYRKLYRSLFFQREEIDGGPTGDVQGNGLRVSVRDLFQPKAGGGLSVPYRLHDGCWRIEQVPDHSTWARFRTGRCAEAVEDLFYQFVRKLEEWGKQTTQRCLSTAQSWKAVRDATPSVWRKSVEKQLAEAEGEGRKYYWPGYIR